MPKKLDPLNKKQYGAVSVMLTVKDIKAAASFYQKAFGFTKRGIMNGPDGQPIHCELRLRDTTLMLGPEMGGNKSAQSLGGSPINLYLLVDNADKVYAKALKLGATSNMPVTDMFWGDRCGDVTDPAGQRWMIATHKAEPTAAEMKKAMKAQMAAMHPPQAAEAGG
ncbi:MAG: VOC family protein [Acidobacteria bacterium]|nr:VOC family protein [Acidobacteriota bacterium]